MDTSKIKNFILIVLVLLNVFLLSMVLADSGEARRTQRETVESVKHVLTQNGIELAKNVELDTEAPNSVTLRRDLAAEEKAVRRLLGSLSKEDLGGNIIYYRGESGEATFRGTGEFDISLVHGAVEPGSDPIQTARNVLSKLGMDPSKMSEVNTISAGGESYVVTLSCRWADDDIFNSRVSFTFTEKSLLLISGRRVMDTVVTRSGEEGLDATTALMRFLDLIWEGGHVCTELRGLTAGYVMNVSVSGDATLQPVWRLETDSGEYYINAITGKAESIGF